MPHRQTLPGILAAGLTASALVVGLLATSAQAAPPTATVKPTAAISSPAEPPPTGVSVSGTDADATQRAPLAISKIHPQRPLAVRQASTKKTAKTTAAAQSCTPADYSSRTGSALVAYVETSTQDCLGTLFGITGTDAHGVFQESQMLTIAGAFHNAAATYPGDDSTRVAELEYFLRAGYYVQFYDAADVGAYDATLTTAVEGGLDAFFASSHLLDVTDANGAIVGDVVILSDSANAQDRYIGVYKRILNSYTSAWDASYNMDGVVYDVYTPLWRGQWNPAFVTDVTADPSVFDTLSAFALNHRSLLGGSNTFMDADAGNDLAVYVQFPALQAKLRPLMLGLLNASAITGTTAALWVSVAGQASTNDQANCSYYGVCNLVQQLTAAALPIHSTCTSTITITAQALSSSDLSAVCASLSSQVPWFQNLVQASGPIPGQTITGENMIVFASRLDYQVYASAIYGIDTNNGGMTITGDPTQAGNSAYSAMYQDPVEAAQFTAHVWNLNHEFTHYLDAVYDTKGDFTAETAVPDVWWIEGIAEYVSYTYRGVVDTGALTDAPLHTYNLSTLFQNTYAIDTTDRTYPWGYLAVRYMWERHPDVMYSMLSHFRTGDYTGAYNVYNSIGTAYDADFNTWLNSLGGTGNLPPCTATDTRAMGQNCSRANQTATTGNTDYLYIYLPAGTTTLTVDTSGGTGNADLYYNPAAWATPGAYTAKSTNPGNTESVTVTNTTAGYRYISLYAVSSFSGVTISTKY